MRIRLLTAPIQWLLTMLQTFLCTARTAGTAALVCMQMNRWQESGPRVGFSLNAINLANDLRAAPSGNKFRILSFLVLRITLRIILTNKNAVLSKKRIICLALVRDIADF